MFEICMFFCYFIIIIYIIFVFSDLTENLFQPASDPVSGLHHPLMSPAPFSLGLSVQLSQADPVLEDIPHYRPPVDNHHHHQEHHQETHHDVKPGVCPLPDTDYYNGPNHYHDTIPLVPGLGHDSLSYRSCSYDGDCRGNMKCCHLKVGHHEIIMHCR